MTDNNDSQIAGARNQVGYILQELIRKNDLQWQDKLSKVEQERDMLQRDIKLLKEAFEPMRKIMDDIHTNAAALNVVRAQGNNDSKKNESAADTSLEKKRKTNGSYITLYKK